MSVISISEKITFYEKIFGKGTLDRQGKNFSVRCPICEPVKKDKRKFTIRIEDDACHCWTCGFASRSLAKIIAKHGTRALMQEYKDKYCDDDQQAHEHFTGDTDTEEKLELPEGSCMLHLASKGNPDTRAVYRYLTEKRGLTDDDIWYYKICVSDAIRWRRKAIVPSFDANGELNYYVARAIDSNKQRYHNPRVDRLTVIFNELNVDWSSRLVICEGPFDMFKCGENATCILGSEFNNRHALFNKIVQHKTPVAVALDSDAQPKAHRIVRALSEYGIDVLIVDVGAHSDPGAMSKSEFEIALSSAHRVSWSRALLSRLSSISQVRL